MSEKYEYGYLKIDELYVNPDNYRFVEEVEDEISAIIAMFNVNVGDSKKEMVNLANDIIVDGLNPFEMPIVCYDDEIKKYVVYDGNRRITCLKLMTQYNGNEEILKSIPSVAEIYKLEYKGQMEIQCVIFKEADDAIYYLKKIHNDVNNGIGRKQWDSQAKMKAKAADGNKTKSYSIVEFLKKHPKTSPELIDMMNNNRWISKLERAVSFSLFRETYNIEFNNNNIHYSDTQDHVLKMLSKLVADIIQMPATGNFRFRKDFENYVMSLPKEYKSLVLNDAKNTLNNNAYIVNKETADNNNSSSVVDVKNDKKENGNIQDKKTNNEKFFETGLGIPKNITSKYITMKEALRLSKNYRYEEYDCLNEKGRQILVELESLNINDHIIASAALCRCILEYVLKLWMTEMSLEFNSNSLPSTYNTCITNLRNQQIIDNNEHSILKVKVRSDNFITILNTWIHADTDACVSKLELVSGWNSVRMLIEKYIETHRK